MKKIKLLSVGLLASLLCYSQPGQINQINIVSFSVKTTLPGNIDSWLTVPGALIMVAQKVPNPVPLREPRLVVQIRSGGAVICGNTVATGKPVDPFDVRTFNTADLTGVMTNCHDLKEGNYSICVQFFNIDKVPISREVCKEFRVEAQKNTEYAPPTLITPEDAKTFTLQQLGGPVTFRWTPIVPKPTVPVTYRIRVWQLMEGQNGNQAMKTNTPVFTKDVENLTQATTTGLLTGPCKPPYLCDFIWNVQALTREGKPIGTNNGTSEPFHFSATSENKCVENVYPENNKKLLQKDVKESITFRWTKMSGASENATYRLKVWQLMEGQTGLQAMKSNNPVATKEVKNAMELAVPGIYTGPCKPPYLCDFIWAVEMVSNDGRICTSEPTVFKIGNNDIDIQVDSVYVSCCLGNGLQNIYIKIKNNLSNTVKITNLNIDKINGVTNVISITGLSPVLPVNIPGLGSQAFTGTIKCIDSAKTIRFFVRAEDAFDNAITETEVETDTLNCPCDPCRWMPAIVDKDSLSLPKNGNPTQINLMGSFTGLNNNIIKKVTAEIIYFNVQQTKDTNCAKCVFDSKNYGNFYPPGSSLPGYTGPVFNKPDYSRLITWNSTIIKDCGGQPNGGGDNGGVGDPTNGRQTPKTDFGDKSMVVGPANPPPPPSLPTFNLPIAVPEMNSLSCCGDVIRICVRYTFYDFCCHACEVIKCYQVKREK